MRKTEVVFYTLLIAAMSIATAHIVMGAVTGQGLQRFWPAMSAIRFNSGTVSYLGECTDQKPREDLQQAQDPHLLKLERYQAACRSLAADRLMIFTDMPKDAIEARNKAVAMANTLGEFKKYQIIPLVIVEPVSDWGLIDFNEFDTGFYDDWIRTYFQVLKEQGVSDAEMGIWVPFPEANLPLWNNHNTSPEEFALVVNRYLGLLKEVFPEAQGSILLNSATYETSDFNWESGEYVSLVPYVEKLDSRLVDSMGLQGFPWLPPASVGGPGVVDPAEYLNPPLLIEAARVLGVTEVWLNTGTFAAKYTFDPAQRVTVSAQRRATLLDRTIVQMQRLQAEGLTVWVNIFAEDKSATAEATDWSYTQASDSDYMIVLTNFIRRATDRNIHVSLFDR